MKCVVCDRGKALKHFVLGKRTCKKCHRERGARWRKENPQKSAQHQKSWRSKNLEKAKGASRSYHRRHQLKIKQLKRAARLRGYGLTQEQYDGMLAQQKKCCAICGTKDPGGRWKRFQVDHCHTTNKVRGLLCVNCNRALGYLGDDPVRAERAARYLRRHK